MGEINGTLLKGELTALIGANGAGKSTLLHTLSGFHPPLSGRILYYNGFTTNCKAHNLSKISAVVLTNSSKIYNLTVEEVVALGRTPYTGLTGHNRKEDNAIVQQAIQKVKIQHLAHRDINSLSDGERQKVMIAKALAQATDIIILDEPTAYLDFKSKIELFRLLKTLASEEKKAILVSTHDIEPVLQIADKLWLIHEKKLYCGTVRELSDKKILHSFINSEEINYNSQENKIEILQPFQTNPQI